VAAEKELKANPDKFLALAKELQKGYDKAYADKNAWVELAKTKLPDVDAALLPGTYDVYKGAKMYPETGTAPLTPERWKAIERFFLDVKEIEKPQSDEMVKYDILNQASGAK
jgi:ABC-type nitrate/sulfonate/bicarbonate transport system substrate-binding protein